MRGTLDPTGKPNTHLKSIELLCGSPHCWSAAKISSAVAIRNDSCWLWPFEWLDDAAIVWAVQGYLQCVKAGFPPTLSQEHAWSHFYKQYAPVVRRVIAASSRQALPTTEADDLSQEVWKEIVVQLPKLVYSPGRARLSSWLAGLATKKIRRLANTLPPSSAQDFVGVESVAESLRSRDLGPEDMCFMGEIWAQLEAALAKLRQQATPKTYEVFCRRFFWGQSVKDVAVAVELSSHEVRCRCHRATRKWRTLTKSLAVLERAVDVPQSSKPLWR